MPLIAVYLTWHGLQDHASGVISYLTYKIINPISKLAHFPNSQENPLPEYQP